MNKHSTIKQATAVVVQAPLIYPFRTALGQHDNLENIIFCLELRDGTKGYGEAAVATHITGETVAQTLANLKTIGVGLQGKDVSEYLTLSAELHERFSNNKSAIAAIEMAIMDALCRQWQIPLWRFFGSRPQRIVSDITIVISSETETEQAVKAFVKQGFRAFKVKIGRDQDLDLKRVLAVKRLAPKARIYLDANQGYSSQDTLRFLKLLRQNRVVPDLIEQPVPKSDFEGLIKVSRLGKVPVCADESAGSLTDVNRIIRFKAAAAVNIKLMKFGLFRAREVYSLAKANGLRLMIGGMMETSLSMTAAAHLAAGLGGIEYIDLDCPFFIKPGWEKNPYLSSRGVYDLEKVKAGIGIVPKCF
ncbi:MAG: dipeptide epimerase [Candidatus Omnitrophica bacterium]|nr:dipeptide epimerase [Candidatus Omnitrophota bacterium]